MCDPGRPCPTLGFADLAALTDAATRHRDWLGPAVLAGRLTGDGFGKTTGRVVRYADSAPACTVPHELAHVLQWPNVDHDREWQADYVWTSLIVVQVWGSTLAARGITSARPPTAAT